MRVRVRVVNTKKGERKRSHTNPENPAKARLFTVSRMFCVSAGANSSVVELSVTCTARDRFITRARAARHEPRTRFDTLPAPLHDHEEDHDDHERDERVELGVSGRLLARASSSPDAVSSSRGNSARRATATAGGILPSRAAGNAAAAAAVAATDRPTTNDASTTMWANLVAFSCTAAAGLSPTQSSAASVFFFSQSQQRTV